MCRVLLILAGLATAALLTYGGTQGPALSVSAIAAAAESQGGKSAGPPPLVVDKEAPLLLDEPTETQKSAIKRAGKRVADNSPCLVCHVNYKDEPLARQHAGVTIGCVNCHGKSFAHRNDENNTTPPERMYRAEKIDPACGKCHTSHDVPAAKVIARWQERCPTKTDAKRIVCTDCHGQHRLKIRTVRWDKRTGKLIELKK